MALQYQVVRTYPGLDLKIGAVVTEEACRNARQLERRKVLVRIHGTDEQVAGLQQACAALEAEVERLRAENAAKDEELVRLRKAAGSSRKGKR